MSDNEQVPQDENLRLIAVVEGRVQGVGFRAFVQRQAADLGVSGWVRNRWEGTVEVVAEGERQQLERLLQALHLGPRTSNITRVKSLWEQPTGQYNNFRVRETA